jgi:hypothetical protein
MPILARLTLVEGAIHDITLTRGWPRPCIRTGMSKHVSYKRHRFPPEIIAHAVWLYFRFPLSLRLVEEMLLERGILVSYETVRRWALKFGPDYARRLKRKRPSRRDVWHLDEVVVTIAGKKHWLWRAVDQDGYVLDEGLCRNSWQRIERSTRGSYWLMQRAARTAQRATGAECRRISPVSFASCAPLQSRPGWRERYSWT